MAKYKDVTAKTRQNIIDAFWELYCEKRIDKITIGEITMKAGYNRSTFYEYFSDVYDVLEQIEQSLLPNIEELPPLKQTSQGEGLAIDLFIKLYYKSSKYYTVLLGDKGDPAFAGRIKNGIKEKLKAEIGQVNQQDFELDYTLEYMLSAMIGILTYWFKNNENISKEDLLRLIYELNSGEKMKEIALKFR